MSVIWLVFGARQPACPRAESRGEDLTSIDVLLVIERRIVLEVRSFPTCHREKERTSGVNLHRPLDAQSSASSCDNIWNVVGGKHTTTTHNRLKTWSCLKFSTEIKHRISSKPLRSVYRGEITAAALVYFSAGPAWSWQLSLCDKHRGSLYLLLNEKKVRLKEWEWRERDKWKLNWVKEKRHKTIL